MSSSLMQRLRRSPGEAGFTLIELLVVVIIIAILAAIAVPVYIGIQNNAKKSAIASDVANTKINVYAVLTEDGEVPTGTYINDTSTTTGPGTGTTTGSGATTVVTGTTAAGAARIQNSHSPSDEVVAVRVVAGPAGGAPEVHVVGYSPSIDYTAYTDPGTGATKTGNAADGQAQVAGTGTGGTGGSGTTPTTPAATGFKLCNPGSTDCITISTARAQMANYSASFGGGPVYAYRVTQTSGNFGLAQNAGSPGQQLSFTRSDVNYQMYGQSIMSADYLNSFGFYDQVPNGTYWLQIDQPIFDKITCFSLSNGGCSLSTGQPTTNDGSASAR